MSMSAIPAGLLISLFMVAAGSVNAADHAPKLLLTTRDWAPYHYLDGQAAVGPVVDVIKCATAVIGSETRIELHPWARAQAMVADGVAQGFFAAGPTPERGVYSVPTAPVGRSVIRWLVIADLAGRAPDLTMPVASVRGSAGIEYIRTEGYQTAIDARNYVHLITLMKEKRVSGAIANPLVFAATLKNAGLSESDLGFSDGPIVREGWLNAHFNRKFLVSHPRFLANFNKALGECYPEGKAGR